MITVVLLDIYNTIYVKTLNLTVEYMFQLKAYI